MRGQIHVQMVNVDSPGPDQFYFKHLRLEETCEDGQHEWEARHDEGAWPTLMGPVTNRACFLSDVTGAFDGTAEYFWIREQPNAAEPEAQQWTIDGQSHAYQKLEVKARCINAQNVSSEYRWVEWLDGSQAKVLEPDVPSDGRVCFLTGMQGDFSGADEDIHLTLRDVDEDGNVEWIFGGSNSQNTKTGGYARCIDAANVSDEITTRSWGESNRTRLDSSAGRVCGITQIRGGFAGTGERVWITEELYNGIPTWFLNTHSLAGGMRASARCWDAPN
jgi:hypothetical protein